MYTSRQKQVRLQNDQFLASMLSLYCAHSTRSWSILPFCCVSWTLTSRASELLFLPAAIHGWDELTRHAFWSRRNRGFVGCWKWVCPSPTWTSSTEYNWVSEGYIFKGYREWRILGLYCLFRSTFMRKWAFCSYGDAGGRGAEQVGLQRPHPCFHHCMNVYSKTMSWNCFP